MESVEIKHEEIDKLFCDLDQCRLPGASVGIALSGTTVYRKSFGVAHMELPVLLSPSIRMRIHSITKHFTCLAFMLLCEEGKATLDASIRSILPELNPVCEPVTVRHLMGNVGGLRDANDICFQFSGAETVVASRELFSLYESIDDVNFPPSTTWCYSNGGFLLLSLAIERIEGKKLGDVFRERIFEPIGLHDTCLRPFDLDFLPNSASGHTPNSAGGFEKRYMPAELTGEGGLVSTLDDMLLWLAHIRAPQIGSRETWSQMTTPCRLANGTLTAYGLGLMLGQYRGVDTIYHAGGSYGANSYLLRVPSADLDLVILMNRSDISAQDRANKILDTCIPGLAPPKTLTLPIANKIPSGVFASRNTGRVVQIRIAQGDQPWIKKGHPIGLIDGLDMPLYFGDDGALRTSDALEHLKLELVLSEDQDSNTLILRDFGTLDHLQPVGPPSEIEAHAVIGRYRSESTGTEAVISRCAAGFQLKTVGRFGHAEFNLDCIAEGIWRSTTNSPVAWGGILQFDRKYSSFSFTSLLTRALPFSRCAAI